MIWTRTSLPARARKLAANAPWQRLVLLAILGLSSFLELFRITREGYGNTYYAATVKSMLTSWHNFFFASYDPGGFVTVDKPPLGFWVQAASAELFGFHGWSLLLPQALAAILSVALLYHLVRRTFGPVAGLLAALTLALTPITVATARNNTVDCLLVLVVLVAAWAIIRATETGRLRWLLLGMFLVGLGFNIKMLQAYLVVPAFLLLYLVAAPRSRWTRVAQLALATVVLLGVSLSWAVAVDLTPSDERPYVGGSTNNTVLDLIVDYNGLDRLLPGWGKLGSMTKQAKAPLPATRSTQDAAGKDRKSGDDDQPKPGQGKNIVAIGGGAGGEAGYAGPLRLLNQQLAGQVGWLLPRAVLGLAAAGWRTPCRWRGGLDRRHQALLLWGTWLLTAGAFFSVAGFWHRYYSVMLSPTIAAVVGAGVVALWEDYRWSKWRWWVLPAALVGMAALHAHILADYADWSRRLTPVIVGLCAVATTVLVVAHLSTRLSRWAHPEIAAATGMLALLIAPTVWIVITVWTQPPGTLQLPYAGPSMFEELGSKSNSKAMQIGLGGTHADPKLVKYLLDHRGDAYRGYLLKNDAGTSFAVTLGTVLAERLLDLIVLAAMLGATVLVAFRGILPPGVTDALVFGLLLSGLGIVGVLAIRRFRGVVEQMLSRRLYALYERFERGTVGSFRRVPLLIAYSALGWIIEGSALYLTAAAVGAPVPIVSALVVVLVASLLTTVPFAPSELGFTEAGMVLLLKWLGLDTGTAGAVALIFRVINYWSIVALGSILYVFVHNASSPRPRRPATGHDRPA